MSRNQRQARYALCIILKVSIHTFIVQLAPRGPFINILPMQHVALVDHPCMFALTIHIRVLESNEHPHQDRLALANLSKQSRSQAAHVCDTHMASVPVRTIPPIAWLKDPEGWHAVEILGDAFVLPNEENEMVVVCWLPEAPVPRRITRKCLMDKRAWPKDDEGDPAPMLSVVPRQHLLYHDDMLDAVAKGKEVAQDVLQRDKAMLDMCMIDATSPTLRFLNDRSITSEEAQHEFFEDLGHLNECIQASLHRQSAECYEEVLEYMFLAGNQTRVKFASSVHRPNPLLASDVLFQRLAPTRERPKAAAHPTKLSEWQAKWEKRWNDLQDQIDQLKQNKQPNTRHVGKRKFGQDDSTSNESEYLPKKSRERGHVHTVVMSDDSDDSEETTDTGVHNFARFCEVTANNSKLTKKLANKLDRKVNRSLPSMVEEWIRMVETSTDDTVPMQDTTLEQLVMERVEQLQARSDSITPDRWELLKSVLQPRFSPIMGPHKLGKCWACKRTKHLSKLFHFGTTNVAMGRDCAYRVKCVLAWHAFIARLQLRASPQLREFESTYNYVEILEDVRKLENAFEQFMTGEGEE